MASRRSVRPSTKVSRSPDLLVEVQGEGHRINKSGHDGDGGVKFGAKQQRHLVAEDVAQHAACTAGDHPRHHHDHKRQRDVDLPGDVATGHGEHHEADGVENKESGVQPIDQLGHQDRHQRSTRRQQKKGRVLHPQQRIMSEQDIADGAAAKRGDATEHAHADPIHAAPSRRQRRRHCLRRNRNERQDVQDRVSWRKGPHLTLLELWNRNRSSFLNRLQD